MQKRLKTLAPAKINLYLEVGKKLHSGYHSICTIMQTVSLFDEISLVLNDSSIDFKCNWSGINFSGDGVVCGDSVNIACRAAVKLKNCLKETRGAKIRIKKNIPVGAGLGGGSSDSAAVIKGLMKLWGRKIPERRLKEISLELGADVNFFLYGGCCVARNIGEDIAPLKSGWAEKPLRVVLVNPGFCLRTADVYAGLEERKNMDTGIIDGIKKLDKQMLGSVMFNRLEEVVFRRHPQLQEIKGRLLSSGSVGSLMSGSGSTVYGVFDNPAKAVKAYRDIRKQYPHSWLVKTIG